MDADEFQALVDWWRAEEAARALERHEELMRLAGRADECP
jgi:hypothetical protein